MTKARQLWERGGIAYRRFNCRAEEPRTGLALRVLQVGSIRIVLCGLMRNRRTKSALLRKPVIEDHDRPY